jgi:hypothetical protein
VNVYEQVSVCVIYMSVWLCVYMYVSVSLCEYV